MLASAAGAVVGMTVLGVISATSGWRYRLPTCCGARPPCWLVRIRQSWATHGWEVAPQATPLRFDLDTFWSVQAFEIDAQAGPRR